MTSLRRYEDVVALVLGYGRSGRAVARALRAGGAKLCVHDDNPRARALARADGLAVVDGLPADASLVVVSPGVPFAPAVAHPAVRAARRAGVALDNDVGLFFERLGGQDVDAPRVVGITGTNGKSTTTALVVHVLRENGVAAVAAGNIGRPVFDLGIPAACRAVVLELSSFQLEGARRLAADVGVLLNLEPDHGDRHGGHAGYVAAKTRLFLPPRPSQKFVIGVEDDVGLGLARRLLHSCAASGSSLDVFGREDAVGGFPSGIAVGDGTLRRFSPGDSEETFALGGCPTLPGAHSLRNVAAAMLVARAFGISDAAAIRAARSFPGLPHRLEPLGEVDGVLYCNDSKATNPAAAARALAAFDRIRWIAGGRAKPGGFAALLPHLERIRKAYLIGEAAGEIAGAIGGRLPAVVCGDLESAFAAAAADAEAGDQVLLSPACASFDQFAGFEERGDMFRRLFEAARDGAEADG